MFVAPKWKMHWNINYSDSFSLNRQFWVMKPLLSKEGRRGSTQFWALWTSSPGQLLFRVEMWLEVVSFKTCKLACSINSRTLQMDHCTDLKSFLWFHHLWVSDTKCTQSWDNFIISGWMCTTNLLQFLAFPIRTTKMTRPRVKAFVSLIPCPDVPSGQLLWVILELGTVSIGYG